VGVELLGDSNGYPILWCHGGLSSRLDAVALNEAATAAGAAIVSLDRPGIGTSARRSHITVADWAEMALAEMTRQGHQRFSVAGWSAGGPYALACGAAGTGRVDRVATVASMHPLVDDRYRRELGMRFDRVLFRWAVGHPGRARMLVRVGSHAPDRMVMSDVMKSSVEAERMMLRANSRLILDFVGESTRCGVGGVVDDYARLAVDWGFDLASVECDVTLWHGSDDPLVPVAHGRDLADRLEKARFEELHGRGHFLPFTDGSRIIADLVDPA